MIYVNRVRYVFVLKKKMDEINIKIEENDTFIDERMKNPVESDPLSLDEENQVMIKEEINADGDEYIYKIINGKPGKAASDTIEIPEQKVEVKDEYTEEFLPFYVVDSDFETSCGSAKEIVNGEMGIIDLNDDPLMIRKSECQGTAEEKCWDSYICQICNKTFPSKSGLVRHEVVHTGDRPYECELCKKSYPYSSGLKRHYRTHSNSPVYECIVCKKLFISENSLQVHLQNHSVSKRLECEICKKPFFSKYTLKAHMLVHTTEKLYTCKECDKTFTTRGNLKKHLNIHTSSPLKCNIWENIVS